MTTIELDSRNSLYWWLPWQFYIKRYYLCWSNHRQLKIFFLMIISGPLPAWAPKGGPHGRPRCRASRAFKPFYSNKSRSLIKLGYVFYSPIHLCTNQIDFKNSFIHHQFWVSRYENCISWRRLLHFGYFLLQDTVIFEDYSHSTGR